jgi:hypothetical protein
MAESRILVPYNFAPHDRKALDFVVRTFAGRREIKITLFNAYTPLPDMETRDSPAIERIKQSLNYLMQQIREMEENLERARQDLVAGGFGDDQVETQFVPRKKDVAGQILETASSGTFQTIVLSREPRKMKRFFSASVHQKVIEAAKNATVCVAG